MKLYILLLFIAALVLPSCHKNTAAPIKLQRDPGISATTIPALPPSPDANVYPYDDTFYGQLKATYDYEGIYRDTMMEVYVRHTGPHTLQFMLLYDYFIYYRDKVVFSSSVPVNMPAHYLFQLSKKDYFEYTLKNDSLYYYGVDKIVGPDYDEDQFAGKLTSKPH